MEDLFARCPCQWRKLLCLLAFLSLYSPLLFSQAAFPDSLLANTKTLPREKVFVHTDKSFYLAGETLWFSAYVLRAETHQATSLSKVLYVELLNERGQAALQAMIELKNGRGDGSFVLPPSLSSGAFLLRAYTSWMRNFDDPFFQLPIEVVNTTRSPDWGALEKKKTFAIQFFPEGGDLVEGIRSKLAFELVDSYGKGVPGEGAIVANGRDTVLRFRPLRFGIGSADFAPKAGDTYKAFVRLPTGEVFMADLPPIVKQGRTLALTEEQQRVRVVVNTNIASDGPLYLLLHANKKPAAALTKQASNGKAEWVVNKSELGDGINRFTIYDAAYRPVCERLWFKRPDNTLAIQIIIDSVTYEKRSPVQLRITANDKGGKTADADLSLSVFLLDSLQGAEQLTIDEFVWLTSELKGTIESPGYYLANDSEEGNAALDNLLLTHGWRRFGSSEVAQTKDLLPRFLPEYEGALIGGRLVDKGTGLPVANKLCFLSVPGKRFFAANALSNERGEIHFVAKNIYGPVELVIQANGADSLVRFEMADPYARPAVPGRVGAIRLSPDWKEQLQERHLNVQLANAFATPDMQRYTVPAANDSSLLYGVPDSRYRLDEFTRFPSMEEVMREIVYEVRLNKEKDTFHYRVNNLPYRQHFSADPLLLFDGVPVFNANQLISFDPLKVKQIDVVARTFFWGNLVANGVVSYQTYNGDLADFNLDPGVVTMEYNGLQVKREFYAPSYPSPAQKNSRESDRRTLLSWIPALQSGSVKTFYASDVPGRYAIRAQGMDSEGRIGSAVKVIAVK